jgi:hypothetical protein
MAPLIELGDTLRLDSKLTTVAIGMDGFRATNPWQ